MYDKLKTSLFATDSQQLRKLTTWLGYVSSFWNTCKINAFVNHNKNIVLKFQSLILTQLKVGCRISFSRLSEVVLTLCLELCELNWLWILSMDFYNRCWLHEKLLGLIFVKPQINMAVQMFFLRSGGVCDLAGAWWTTFWKYRLTTRILQANRF